MPASVLILMIWFQFKHFLGDFPLQTVYMLGKGKSGIQWVLPLGAHCLVHAVLSWLIILCVNPQFSWLVVAEFAAHFVIDRIKATYKLPAGQWAQEDKGKYLSKYYLAFGIDQMAHQFCYAVMIYLLVS